MEVLTLWPLSQGELAGVTEGFIDAVFAEPLPQLGPSAETRSSLLQRMTTGGFPEVVARRDPARRRAWIRSYTTTVLQRDVRDLANIEALTDLPRLLRLAAGRSGSLVNVAALSSDIGLPQTSLRRYLTLLQATFILVTLPSWSANVGRRVVRSPKFHLNDSALLSHLIGFEPGAIRTTQDAVGQLTENFVVMELRKQAAWSVTRPELFFFRTYEGNEVDVVLEGDDGRVVGIEVKASATVGPRDFRGLAFLRDRLGDRFVRGILLYTGEHTLPFGQRLVAMPVDALWRLGATPSG
jgi:predicted AAA+ superfamily ATPase